MELAIDVTGLSKHFAGKPVVNDISLSVPKGEVMGFLGPNGSGKTTTMRLLCGLLTPDSGQGKVLGLDFMKGRKQIKNQTGYMTQRFSLYEDLTIKENLLFAARMYELPNYQTKVHQTILRLGLEKRENQLAGTLSGGWKQRLALATSTLHSPKLLLLDEPTAGVDPKARREFWDEIHALASAGLTVLVSTHYMDEAERCHSIAYIANGRIIARGGTEQIIKQSGLVTLAAKCAEEAGLFVKLQALPEVITCTVLGKMLHVTGKSVEELRAVLAKHTKASWQQVDTSLEDVFIFLVKDSARVVGS